ncbi:MAG: insulinase family protein [Bryobacteraceae bacterium]|nr:insulinase family protein [Bryobacteraceae bacterium]
MIARSLAALLAGGLLWAQAPAKVPSLPGYQELKYPPLPQVKIPEIAVYTLSNGMKLYLLENHELPLVGGFALVRTGNLFDPPGKIGLADLTGEVMRTGGTRDKPGDEIDVQLENIAASVEAGIGETSGTVSFNCLRENVDEVLQVFKAVLTEPEFRQDKVDLAKTQSRSIIARRNDNPSAIASREFSSILYGRDTPYGWDVEYEHVDRIARDDMVAFHKRYFFPANIMLALQGDFAAPAMKDKLEKLFADWNVQQPPVPAFPPVQAKPSPGVFLATKEDVNQTFFRIGHLAGVLKDEDYPALQVVADILGGGFSSRLFRKVRTELGYAYSVGANWGANYNHPGAFSISGSTKSESTTATIETILGEVERIRTGEVTDEELKTAKEKVLNSFVFNFDQPGKTLNRLVIYEYHGYPKDFIFQYQKAVESVTKAEILEAAKKRLNPDQLSIVAVGKPSEFGRELSELNLPIKPIDLTIPEPKREASKADSASLAKGKELLQRAQQAVGGAGKLEAVNDFTMSANVHVTMPQGAMNVTQLNRWLKPSHVRQEQELPFGKMSSYFDGKTGWLSTPQGTQPMPDIVARQVRGAVLRSLPLLLLSDRLPGRSVNLAEDGLVEITDASGESVQLKVNPETGLPESVTYQSLQMTGQPATLVDAFDDWQEFDGIRQPRKVAITRDGQPYAQVEVKEIRFNSGLTVEELSKQP